MTAATTPLEALEIFWKVGLSSFISAALCWGSVRLMEKLEDYMERNRPDSMLADMGMLPFIVLVGVFMVSYIGCLYVFKLC